MNATDEQIRAEIQGLEAGRDLFRSMWDDCAKAVNPRHSRQVSNPTSLPNTADVKSILDTTAMQSCQTLASGQMAHITPMGQEWFRLAPPDELKDVPAAVSYYANVTVAIRNALANSNFYNVMHEQYLDHGAYGTAALEVTEGRNRRGVHFRPLTIGSYCIAEDHYGMVNTVTRAYKLTAQQAIGLFGREALPWQLLKDLDEGSRNEHSFTQYIRPKADYDEKNPFHSPYESFDIYDGGKDKFQVLKKSRYNEPPIIVSRWMKWGENCPYGFAPSLFALPPHKQASYLETLADFLGELTAFPRTLIPASLKGEIDYRPGSATFFDPNMGSAEMPREWMTGGNYNVLNDRIDRKHAMIKEAFFVPLFELITQQTKQMTAFEVQQRVAEKGALFHPIFVRTVSEKLTPLIMRVYSILARQPHALPPAPPEVITQGHAGAVLPDPAVQYVSPLALAITQNQVSGLPSVLQTILPLAQADPSVLKSVNMEALFPVLARAAGLPEAFIRTPEQMEAIDAAQMQAAQMQQIQQMADTAGKLGGAQGIKDLAELEGQQPPPTP